MNIQLKKGELIEAYKLIIRHESTAPSLLQRKMAMGYHRASTIIMVLSDLGILGPHKGPKMRDILVVNYGIAETFINGWENSRDMDDVVVHDDTPPQSEEVVMPADSRPVRCLPNLRWEQRGVMVNNVNSATVQVLQQAQEDMGTGEITWADVPTVIEG